MSKRVIGVFIATVLAFGLIFIIARNKQRGDRVDTSPIKLVVGVVVDQMRSDYLYRFSSNYTERGFKRLMAGGTNFRNVRYNYIPTKTGPGHASIYTGTTPSVHGIVSNEWYKGQENWLNCVADPSVEGLGGGHQGQPSYSPKNLLVTTVSDVLKLANPRSKTIGISFKNRGAILPVGHTADYAFWYDKTTGAFVTSTYYTDTIPQWLHSFNRRGYVERALGKLWTPKLPLEKYTHSTPDDAPFEKVYPEEKKSIFPHKITSPKRFYETPYANILLTELAKEVVEKESLGQDNHTDFLTISYSATDAIGHLFGIRSKEVEDVYVWLDLQLAVLLEYLDRTVGEGNYVLVLTSDHGAVDHPGFLTNQNIPSGSLIKKSLKQHIDQNFDKEIEKYGALVEAVESNQLHLSEVFREELYQNSVLRNRFIRSIASFKGIRKAFFAEELDLFCTKEARLVRNGYHPDRGGDIYFLYEPGWIPQRNYGTTHGTHYTADTHIPLLWYGAKIPKGKEIFKPYQITDIAPTISSLLRIPLPASSSGVILEEVF